MTKSTGRRGRTQRRKEKDEREWTTLEQKEYLKSRQAEYSIARDKKRTGEWFSVELNLYFKIFPTQMPTEDEKVKHGMQWSVKDKRLLEEKRVRDWFKNHSRPSTQSANQKREVFNLKRESKPKRLSDAQRFSKLYYTRFYRNPVRVKWRKTYLDYYERLVGDSTDVKVLDKKVNDSIRKELRAGQLDITVTAAGGAEDDEDEDDDEDERDDEKDDDDITSEAPKVPKVAVWYRNAVMAELWTRASPSQRDAVQKHKMEEGEETDEIEEFSDDEAEHEQKQTKRLEEITSRRSALERTLIRLLDQVYEETGLVGTICLAGPDPQKGGKLMSLSIHKTFGNGSSFPDLYPNYKRAVADPMRSYASLFFPTSERFKWVLPGTEQLFDQPKGGQELAALRTSSLSVPQLMSPARSVGPNPSPRELSPGLSTTLARSYALHRQAIHNLKSGSLTPSSLPAPAPTMSGNESGHEVHSTVQTERFDNVRLPAQLRGDENRQPSDMKGSNGGEADKHVSDDDYAMSESEEAYWAALADANIGDKEGGIATDSVGDDIDNGMGSGAAGVGDSAGDSMGNGTNDGAGNGTIDGVGNGAGNGTSNGAGNGVDNGTGNGAGNGTGNGADNGTGNGADNGTGNGADNGTGNGTGDGDGSESVVANSQGTSSNAHKKMNQLAARKTPTARKTARGPIEVAAIDRPRRTKKPVASSSTAGPSNSVSLRGKKRKSREESDVETPSKRPARQLRSRK